MNKTLSISVTNTPQAHRKPLFLEKNKRKSGNDYGNNNIADVSSSNLHSDEGEPQIVMRAQLFFSLIGETVLSALGDNE